MDVAIAASTDEVAHLAADGIEAALRENPSAAIGLATGSSPVAAYAELGRRVRAGRLSLAGCSAYLLDDYVGLEPGHPRSYRAEIDDIFTRLVDIAPGRVHGPDTTASDPQEACAAYEQEVLAARIDVQVLGIGTDGHIGFNEAASSLASRTRVVALAPQTRRDNARFFDGDLDAVPTHAISQGVATILAAQRVLLIATGEGKARAVRQLVEGPISARWPATALQLHPHVTVVLDEVAAGQLELIDHYREAWAGRS